MINVRLDQFEGPLGLLLYLIRKEEMNIYDIPIHRITAQYFEHIKKMRELDLEVAGEFIAMAATLIHIKSRMLLPQYDENGEVVEATDDPRRELVKRLLEYEKFREASKTLNERSLLGRDVWARGIKEELVLEEGEVVVDEGGLFSLISMYRKVVKQFSKSVHTVKAKGQSIAARILEIRDRLMPGHRVTLRDLVSPIEWSSTKVLITFLSLLELTKMGFTTLFQSETYGDIHVDTKRDIDRNVIDRVEEYDRQPEAAADIARALESDAGGRDLHDLNQTADEQLGLVSQASQEGLAGEVLSPAEEVASDEEILAAEESLGMASPVLGLERVDEILENFRLKQETETETATATEVLSQATPSEPTEQTIQTTVEPGPILAEEISPESRPLTNEDFELAWAQFEESVETQAKVAAAQNTVLPEQAPEQSLAPEALAVEEKSQPKGQDRSVLSLVSMAKASMAFFDEPRELEASEELEDEFVLVEPQKGIGEPDPTI